MCDVSVTQFSWKSREIYRRVRVRPGGRLQVSLECPLKAWTYGMNLTLEPDRHHATLPGNFRHAKNGDPGQGRHWLWGFRGPSPNPQVTITYFSNKLVMHLKTNWRYARLKLSSNFCEARTSKRKYFIGGTRFLWMHSLIRQQITQKFTLGVT